MASPVHIKRVAGRVIDSVKEGHQVVVVVSAMGDTTDDLIDLANKVSGHQASAREMDMLLSTGEQISIALLAMALHAEGQGAVSFTGWQAGIETEDVPSKARITAIKPTRVQQELQQGNVVIVAGFQGKSSQGDITTLGRGGSDTTAVALAAALQADMCEIYTDVDGVYSTDPRVVSCARKIEEISYDEMLEMANLGAGVLHPRSVEFAKMHGVPLMVRSSFTKDRGTLVKEEAKMEQGQLVRGIAHDENVAKIALVGVPNREDNLKVVFEALANSSINVDIIVQSVVQGDVSDISFTIGSDDLAQSIEILSRLQKQLGAKEVVFEEDLAKVSIVGAGMISNPGVAAKMFRVLADAGMLIRMVSTSEIKVSCVIDAVDVEQAVQQLHTAFELDTTETVTVSK